MKRGTSSLRALDLPGSELDDEPRWQLVQRILASRQFARAPLLSRFLRYICEKTLHGNQEEISEYQIGVQVFDRPATYRTVEDNIVRNYARQLRRRLAEFFAAEGRDEPLRVEIPLGGYIPIFFEQERQAAAREESPVTPVLLNPQQPGELPIPAAREQDEPVIEPSALPHRRSASRSMRIALFGIYSVVLIVFTVLVSRRLFGPRIANGPSSILWSALLRGPQQTLIVPSDCGLNIVQDLSRKELTLAHYLKGDYLSVPLPAMDSHSQADLRTQEFTSFVDLQIVSALGRLPQADSQDIVVRFPRYLRPDDFKSNNVILIGAEGSNPWAEMAQKNLNFRIVYDGEMQSAWVENAHPQHGEQSRYFSQWSEPSHSTYAVIAYEPNIGGNGHILLLEGLDVAGTQAAAEALLHGSSLSPVLQAATRDGALRPFEVLLQSTSIASDAADSQVVAYRVN